MGAQITSLARSFDAANPDMSGMSTVEPSDVLSPDQVVARDSSQQLVQEARSLLADLHVAQLNMRDQELPSETQRQQLDQ